MCATYLMISAARSNKEELYIALLRFGRSFFILKEGKWANKEFCLTKNGNNNPEIFGP